MDQLSGALTTLRSGGFRYAYEWDTLVGPSPRFRGPLVRLSERLLEGLAHQVHEGVADLTGRRWMRDLGDYAELRIGEQEWAGRSGGVRGTEPGGPPGDDQPLWLAEALAGAVSARLAASGDLAVTVDLGSVDFWCAPPVSAGTGQVELEVTLAGNAITRVWWADGRTTHLLTVLEVGVDVDALDWTRLPSFVTPVARP